MKKDAEFLLIHHTGMYIITNKHWSYQYFVCTSFFELQCADKKVLTYLPAGGVGCRTLATVMHKVEESAQDLHQLQSQVSLKQTAMMTEREMAAEARDQALKCMSYAHD